MVMSRHPRNTAAKFAAGRRFVLPAITLELSGIATTIGTIMVFLGLAELLPIVDGTPFFGLVTWIAGAFNDYIMPTALRLGERMVSWGTVATCVVYVVSRVFSWRKWSMLDLCMVGYLGSVYGLYHFELDGPADIVPLLMLLLLHLVSAVCVFFTSMRER